MRATILSILAAIILFPLTTTTSAQSYDAEIEKNVVVPA